MTPENETIKSMQARYHDQLDAYRLLEQENKELRGCIELIEDSLRILKLKVYKNSCKSVIKDYLNTETGKG
jgi:hypothetical protein